VLRLLNQAYLASHEASDGLTREDGQALVEYALILAMITVVTLGALQLIGIDIAKLLDKVSTSLSSAAFGP